MDREGGNHLGRDRDWGREGMGDGEGRDSVRAHTSPTSFPQTPYHEGRRVRGPLVRKVCT